MNQSSSGQPARSYGRVLPNNQQAEQSVLGCTFSGEKPLAEITAQLKPRILSSGSSADL
jgi:hypothetical protein